jgi:hypothetical protein
MMRLISDLLLLLLPVHASCQLLFREGDPYTPRAPRRPLVQMLKRKQKPSGQLKVLLLLMMMMMTTAGGGVWRVWTAVWAPRLS